MNVAVVILNWNGKKLLEQFLPSVMAHSGGAKIYVADNASTDDSVAFLEKNFERIAIIQNSVNGGYAKGYNDALRDLKEELLVLLNNDVEVTPNWLKPIIDEFSNEPKTVAAQPKILDFRNRKLFEYAGAAGGFIDKFGYPYCRGRIFNSLEEDNGQYNDTIEIFWATGACLAIRNEAFREVGGFDEDFFTHQEEIDLCWRLQPLGTVKYIGSSAVYHLGGGTLSAANTRKTYYNFRNTLLLLLKNVRGGKVWWRIFIRLFLDGIAGLRFVLQGKFGHALAVITAHFGFYGLMPRFLKKRRQTASDVKYFQINSIIWNYFILKKRNFNEGY